MNPQRHIKGEHVQTVSYLYPGHGIADKHAKPFILGFNYISMQEVDSCCSQPAGIKNSKGLHIDYYLHLRYVSDQTIVLTSLL